MKPGTHPHSTYRAPRADLPPLTWPAPLDALPPLGITKAPESPGWQDTLPLEADTALFEIDRGTAFEESLNGLQVRELIGNRLFDQLFGER